MRLYFLRDVRAEYAPNKVFKEGCVYDIPLNNISTMLDNNFAVPEEDKPKKVVVIKKPEKVVVTKKPKGRPKKK